MKFILVFVEGFLSFFSPCVLPLIPLYMGYLAGSTQEVDENGNTNYNQKKVMLHTFFFVLGISVAFFILGLSFSAIGKFLSTYRGTIEKIGGAVIILLGLHQMGIVNIKFLQREKRIENTRDIKSMNPVTAFITGFTFSFAWTPCVGPALASVLIMASSAKSAVAGNLLVGVYALGFLIPFIILGLFTAQALKFLKEKRGFMQKSVKIGGAILVILGALLAFGLFGNYEQLFNIDTGITQTQKSDNSSDKKSDKASDSESDSNDKQAASENSSEEDKNSQSSSSDSDSGDRQEVKAPDFELRDINGKTHRLSDYRGKVVMINIWATWCPPCRAEIPEYEKLYEKNKNSKDVEIISITSPDAGRETNAEGIKSFAKEKGINYPVLLDDKQEVMMNYGISSFPTTFVIDKKGNVFGYVTGGLNLENFEQILKDALAGVRHQ